MARASLRESVATRDTFCFATAFGFSEYTTHPIFGLGTALNLKKPPAFSGDARHRRLVVSVVCSVETVINSLKGHTLYLQTKQS